MKFNECENESSSEKNAIPHLFFMFDDFILINIVSFYLPFQAKQFDQIEQSNQTITCVYITLSKKKSLCGAACKYGPVHALASAVREARFGRPMGALCITCRYIGPRKLWLSVHERQGSTANREVRSAGISPIRAPCAPPVNA